MSIQTVIDRAQQIEFDRKRVVAQTFSRSQRIKTSERASAQPYRVKVTPPAMLPWTASRAMIEIITLADRVTETEIDFSHIGYVVGYQGEATEAQLEAMTISAVNTASLVLTTLPAVPSSTVLFHQGDVVQPDNSRYPYHVAATVTRGVSTQTTVPLSRSVITSEGITLVGNNILVGNSCTWRVIVTGLPTFKIVPNGLVQFTGDFELVEKII